MHKQVIVIRKDLNMRKGKMVAQGAHASQLAIMKSGETSEWESWYEAWMSGSFTKIALGVSSETELLSMMNAAKEAGLPVSLVEDSGLTEFHGQITRTAIGIGPAPVELIDAITGGLPLL
ncbi:aminoacyl-tRNA hydrolase [Acidithiobacillus sp. M4-SHS-6]|uniref:aminoacyl-tRNA hydrolase n=1 Tax=Acidithiobacillus sp. M4-SHS-6 TaxID=3383024 RepID=UPI0039BE8C41